MEYMYVILTNSLFKAVNNWFGHLADGLLDACFGEKQIESVTNILSLTGKFATGVFDLLGVFLSATKPIGTALVVTYFLMFMFDAAAKEQITVDSLVKVLIQLVLVVALISNLEEIISALLSIGEGVYANVQGIGTLGIERPAPFNTGHQMVEAWLNKEEDLGATIFIQSCLIWIIHQIAIIAIDFAAISRVLELGWRIAFAPIGVANCFEGGASSPAIKYLKGIFAVALSGAAIYVVTIVGFRLSYELLSADDVSGSLFLCMASMLATAGAAIGISGKIKEVVG